MARRRYIAPDTPEAIRARADMAERVSALAAEGVPLTEALQVIHADPDLKTALPEREKPYKPRKRVLSPKSAPEPDLAKKPAKDRLKAELAAAEQAAKDRRKAAASKTKPSLFNEAIAQQIIARVSEGQTLHRVLKDRGMPAYATVLRWMDELPDEPERAEERKAREAFKRALDTARIRGWAVWADELIEIADDSSLDLVVGPDGGERMNSEFVARSKLRIETRKWLLSRMLPKVYGDQVVAHALQAPPPDPVATLAGDIEAARRVAFMLAGGLAAFSQAQQPQDGGRLLTDEKNHYNQSDNRPEPQQTRASRAPGE